jgi:SSS family transporter
VLFIVTRSLADGLRLFLSAIVLQEMTGIPLAAAVVALGVATILYTYFGGMKSVLWTDLIQFGVYITGALVAFWILLDKLPGGWGQLVEVGRASGHLQIFDLTWDLSEPYGLWAGLIGGVFVTLGSHGVDQMMVQRYLCAPRLADARKALCLGGFVIVAQFALFLLIGVGLFVFYQTFPPEVAFERPDRVFARFILDEMPIGLVGLLLGAVFAAAMSTLSSSLNSCATSATHDLYVPLAGDRATPEAQFRMTRTLTAVFGVVQIAVGIGGQYLQDSVVNSIFSIAGFTTGIILGVFFLGMYAPKVGQHAALAGLVVGLVGMTTVFFATSLAWPWYALVGSVATFIVGLLASRIWPLPVRA